jgi:hypothetical protein
MPSAVHRWEFLLSSLARFGPVPEAGWAVFRRSSSVAEQPPCKRQVAGSNPASGSTYPGWPGSSSASTSQAVRAIVSARIDACAEDDQSRRKIFRETIDTAFPLVYDLTMDTDRTQTEGKGRNMNTDLHVVRELADKGIVCECIDPEDRAALAEILSTEDWEARRYATRRLADQHFTTSHRFIPVNVR